MSQTNTPTDKLTNPRLERGLETLGKIDAGAGQKVLDSLKDICPELAQFAIEYPFGDLYCREGLDLKSREIATVASLTTLGNCTPQLKVHLQAAMNVGCSIEEVKEVILQMSVYAGFPAALNAMLAFKEVLQESGQLDG